MTCHFCGQNLNEKKVVLLELNWKTLLFDTPGKISKEDSQGCFEFGKDCANKILSNGGIMGERIVRKKKKV